MRSTIMCLTTRVVVAAAFAVAVGACGRSPEPIVACPAPADACDDLAQQEQAIEAAYAAAAADVGGAAARREAGECAQLLTEAALDGECIDPCEELCRLHPCPVLNADGDITDQAECATRCAEVVADADIAVDIATALDNAAAEPGLCTCRGCGAPDDDLCVALFDCAPLAP